MPGVSITIAPEGSITSSRLVVVWRPFPLHSWISCVACHSSPMSVLSKVDLPTPDEPMKATVCLGAR